MTKPEAMQDAQKYANMRGTTVYVVRRGDEYKSTSYFLIVRGWHLAEIVQPQLPDWAKQPAPAPTPEPAPAPERFESRLAFRNVGAAPTCLVFKRSDGAELSLSSHTRMLASFGADGEVMKDYGSYTGTEAFLAAVNEFLTKG